MKADNFVLYAYGSVMLPILVAMIIGMLILIVHNYSKDKEEERHDLEGFIYRLPCKTNSELLALKARYTMYLSDGFFKLSNKQFRNYINAINKQLEQNDGNSIN